jgi:hypothetical protein
VMSLTLGLDDALFAAPSSDLLAAKCERVHRKFAAELLRQST